MATSLRGIRSAHGADAVGVFGGGGLTNEKAYLLGKFARLALGTSRIDYNGRYCMSSAAAAGNRAFGVDRGLPFPLEDLDGASTVLLLGTNVAETMPPFIGHLAGAQAAGGLVVVDPRRTATARLTEEGRGLHVQPEPGTDLALLLGLIHVVIAERLVDAEYVATRTVGLASLRRSVASWWPERVQAVTGVPAPTIRRLARRLASGEGTYILTGRGVEQHVDGTDTATAAINLALLLGLPGRLGSGYGTLTGQGNGQGGREHGQKCDQLPGYRKITDPEARAHVAGVWGVPPEQIPGPGVPAVELLQSLGRPGGVRGLLVHGSNLVVSSPNVAAVREGARRARPPRRLRLLPLRDGGPRRRGAAHHAMGRGGGHDDEPRGTGHPPPPGDHGAAGGARRALDPGGAGPAARVHSDVRHRPRVRVRGAAARIGGRHRRLLGHRLRHARPRGGGVLAVPARQRRNASPLRRPVRASRRARTARGRVGARVGATRPADGELTLVTGRLLEHYQSGAQTRRVPELLEAQPEALASLHPATAERLGIADGDDLELANRRGTVRCRARLTADIRPDAVFLPFHYGDAQAANLLTTDAVDPISAMPEFKTNVVRVSRLTEAGVPA